MPVTVLLAQGTNGDREVVYVYFLEGISRVSDLAPDSLQLLRSNTALKGNDTVIVTRATLVKRLDSLGVKVEDISPAFPAFNMKDTLGMSADGNVIKTANLANIFAIRVPDGKTSQEVADRLQAMEHVLYAEPATLISYDVVPNEEDCTTCEYHDQWHLENSVNPGRDIHARGAWNIYRGTSASRIAIFDTGVDRNHDELTGKVNGSSTTSEAHGTQVAGVAAARTNNGDGVAGVDWNAQIHAINTTGSDSESVSRLISAAQQTDVVAINSSFGLTSQDGTHGVNSTTFKVGYAYAYKQNKVMTASAGNHQLTEPGVLNYPAAWNEYVIAVAGTNDDDGVRASSTNGAYVDVAAPGTDIQTTTPGNAYAAPSGTSFAAPQVAGLASLLKGMRPDLCHDDVKNLIEISADDVNADANVPLPGWDPEIGHGRINAEEALKLLMEPNELVFRTSAGGAAFGSDVGYYQAQLLGVAGLADGFYLVKRREVRKTVTSLNSTPTAHAWGRGYHSVGYNAANPMYGTNHVEVVSVSGRSITLRTYVYEVLNLYGVSLGWYPTTAANVKFAWAELYTDPGTAYGDGFEGGLGNSYNSSANDVDWVVHSGATPSSGTGPSSAYEGSNYAYVESSSPNYPSKIATLVFPGYNGLGKYHVKFKYHMYGASMGSLKVKYTKPGQGTYTAYTYSGNQGDQWVAFDKNFYDLSSLILEATTGSGYTSDIAIDDMEITRVEDFPVLWTDIVNTLPDGSSILKTAGGTAWNAGAASSNVVPAYTEGWIETRVTDYQSDFMFGLSYTNDNASWNTIDFNLYVSRFNGNEIRVYRRGTLMAEDIPYEVGDLLAVHRLGSSVYFKKNGTTFYTSTADQTKSMVGDICLYNGGLSLYDVHMNFAATGSLSATEALASFNQFDEVFGDPSLLQMRPVGDDYPKDTVTQLSAMEAISDIFKEFTVYPNESNGQFKISYTMNKASDLVFCIRDYETAGILRQQAVRNDDESGDLTMDISDLRDSPYYLEVHNGNQKHVVRIVKKSL